MSYKVKGSNPFEAIPCYIMAICVLLHGAEYRNLLRSEGSCCATDLAQESAQGLRICWRRYLQDCFHFVRVHYNSFFAYYVPEKRSVGDL